MDCSFPTLENIAMMKVIALLCKDWEEELSHLAPHDGFKITHLSQLCLPVQLQNELVTTAKKVYLHLFKFYFKHQCRECLKILLESCHFWAFWSSEDFLNEYRVVKGLATYERLSIVLRFKLACEYFLVDDVVFLWEKLSIFVRHIFFKTYLKNRSYVADLILQRLFNSPSYLENYILFFHPKNETADQILYEKFGAFNDGEICKFLENIEFEDC